jgi:hypothetical protein
MACLVMRRRVFEDLISSAYGLASARQFPILGMPFIWRISRFHRILEFCRSRDSSGKMFVLTVRVIDGITLFVTILLLFNSNALKLSFYFGLFTEIIFE